MSDDTKTSLIDLPWFKELACLEVRKLPDRCRHQGQVGLIMCPPASYLFHILQDSHLFQAFIDESKLRAFLLSGEHATARALRAKAIVRPEPTARGKVPSGVDSRAPVAGSTYEEWQAFLDPNRLAFEEAMAWAITRYRKEHAGPATSEEDTQARSTEEHRSRTSKSKDSTQDDRGSRLHRLKAFHDEKGCSEADVWRSANVKRPDGTRWKKDELQNKSALPGF